jgi:hypothetical protein
MTKTIYAFRQEEGGGEDISFHRRDASSEWSS